LKKPGFPGFFFARISGLNAARALYHLQPVGMVGHSRIFTNAEDRP
jgi:hypothetical protein